MKRSSSHKGFRAVVLAGGRGTRLAPYTFVLPKPLLPIGERPILDLVLARLSESGCRRVTLAVGYLAPLIETYCGKGDRWGVEIDFFREESPLGTVGSLGSIDSLERESFVVMNGDILTDLRIDDFLGGHIASQADLTIACFKRSVRDELGVIEANDEDVVLRYKEKPTHHYEVSMGIYAFAPTVLQHIGRGERLDFPDLVDRLLASGCYVRVHRHTGEWLDVGRHDDFEQANDRLAGR